MPLSPGQSLGHYEIISRIGAGGMGEVYKARDPRLDRFVAIKVLPDHIAKREDLRQRFEREARAVASLNHPNICVLHDIGSQDGTDFMVMEYLEGETLAARIGKGALPLDQTLKYAMQTADALDRAHQAGVTHRDVKPPNIMLTRDGVKMLDFGLAKSAAKVGPTEETLTAALTTEGSILGTPQYMAPEQFAGKEADARCDIWAFGAVLYEMVTGEKAFQGKNYASLMGSILSMEPAPMSVKSFTPVSLEKLVRRCLGKDPEERWQSIRDVLLELRSISAQPEAAGQSPGKRPRIAWVLAGLATAAALAIAIIHFREQPPVQRPIRFEIPMPPGVSIAGWQIPAVSPDGTRIVFPSVRPDQSGAFWMRPLSSAASQLFVDQSGWDPCWSSDSSNVTFVVRGSILRAEVSGGPPQKLIDGQNTYGLACSPDAILMGSSTGPLLQWTASGGAPKPVTKLDASRQETSHMFPQFFPDHRGFIFSAASQGDGSIFAGSLDSPQVKLLVPGALRAVVVPNGYLLYPSGGAVVARRFDWKTLTLSGEPMRVADSVFQPAENAFYASFSASPDVLAYRAGVTDSGSELVWLDRGGKRLSVVGERAEYSNPALSPDGNRLAVGRADPSTKKRDIWIVDLVRGTNSRLTFDAADDLNPVWSPDGKDIVFSSDRSATANERHLFRKSASGTGSEQALSEGAGRNSVEGWSPDGKFVIFNNAADLVMFPAAGGKAQTIIGGHGNQDQSAISPDGKWIAYTSNESGRREIYVQNFPPAGGKWQISSKGGSQPCWRGDGRELFYIQQNELMSVPVKGDAKGTAKEFEAGTPSSLFQLQMTMLVRRNHYVVTRDGSRFLFLYSNTDTMQGPINVVVNWAAGLGK